MHIIDNTTLKILLLVLSLGIDTLTVAVGLGISGIGRKARLRVGTSFAFFEAVMPLFGFFLGQIVGGILGEITSFIGIIVLFGVGIWIIKEGVTKKAEKKIVIDTWKGLLLTSLSVSLDELAVGFSMGALGLPILITVILIGAQAFILTFIGTTFGNRIGEKLSERAELVAGAVLSLLAIILLLEKISHINL